MTTYENDPLSAGLPPRDLSAEQALANVRDANSKLQSGEISFGEKMPALVKELDSQWSYIDKSVMISGKVFCAEAENATSSGQEVLFMDEEILNDGWVMSRGFDVRQVDGEYAIGHVFIYDKDDTGRMIPPQSTRANYMGWAAVDDTIVEPYEVPHHLVEDYLEHYLPDAKTLIDAIAVECESDPMRAIEALKYFSIEHLEKDLVKQQRERNAVSDYLTEQVDIRQFIPYSLAVKGVVFIVDEYQNIISTEQHIGDWLHIQFRHQKFVTIPTIKPNGNQANIDSSHDTSSVAVVGEAKYIDSADSDKYRRVVIPLTSGIIFRSNESTMQRADTDQLD